MVRFCHGNQAVVPHLFLPIELLAFNHTDQPGANSTTWEGRLIHKQQNIDRVSIRCNCPWQKSEIIRKHHPSGENFLERKYPLLRIESEFVAAVCRRFDDDLDDAVVLDQWLQLCWIREKFHLNFLHRNYECSVKNGGSKRTQDLSRLPMERET